MEDAATAEICRAQVWQWVRHGAQMSDGRPVTAELARETTAEVGRQLEARGASATLGRAMRLYERMMTSPEFPEFLTLAAYEEID
jgi:malate synthase